MIRKGGSNWVDGENFFDREAARELGLEPQVAREFEEVAEDIRRELLARPDGETERRID